LRRGHGTGLIRRFCELRSAAGAARIVTDPEPGNAAALGAYGKAGFGVIGPRETPWGRVLLMAFDPPSVREN
jgi:aminoglycoside 6'-N-acetyltransferase